MNKLISLISNKHLVKIINDYVDHKLIFEDELIFRTRRLYDCHNMGSFYKNHRFYREFSFEMNYRIAHYHMDWAVICL
jgi:hypothetical protein